MSPDYGSILSSLHTSIASITDHGTVASYIPELSKVNPDKFGTYLQPIRGEGVGVGDAYERFSIQSIVKVLSLAMVFNEMGDDLFTHVGIEPSGSSFNSLWQLEYESGKPRNPLINSGALIVCDQMVSMYDNSLDAFLSFIREISGLDEIHINQHVANSERDHGFRNNALINLMKSSGTIKGDINTVLDLYYQQCAIEMSCHELAQTFLFFANQGLTPLTAERLITSSKIKRINAIMQTCGFYDEAGEFAFKVGLPGKSGVGGGIVAVHPGYFSVAVWSPRLNLKGNSVKGMQLLEELTTATGLSIF